MKRIRVVAMIARNNGRLLLARRRDGGPRDGHWEFPGGKVEPGETLDEALKREIDEELGLQITPGSPLVEIDWDYPDISVRLTGIAATVHASASIAENATDHDRVEWVTATRARRLKLLNADRAILDQIDPERPAS